ncbi:MAG: alpha-amylase family glycosyl hydrolase [Agriterribacter sp.]
MTTQEQDPPKQAEIIYHVFQRSFYDSNGDKHGDLNGLRFQLDYLQQLGITSILLTPLYQSVYYHNYFTHDFESIDPAYGTKEDYYNLVNDIHQRGMKIYIDMEIQYITEDHEWYRSSFAKPSSSYSNYILYTDKENKIPSTIIFDTNGLEGYNGVYKRITTVNLLNKGVQDYMRTLFLQWIDPLGDGSFIYGADGFRLDHMMDMLDNKPQLSNLFSAFWKPLITDLKKVNPALLFIAEQTDWGSYGDDYIARVGADRVFAFPLREAILSFNKEKIINIAEKTFKLTVNPDQQIVFIENHDTHRFATLVENNISKMKIGATLNLLIGGTPAIYYGQEIGMQGSGGFGKYGNSDGNDIPRREAFKWNKKVQQKGMALWYENSGPWWNDTNLHDDDGISVEEQKDKLDSLWNFYEELITLKKENPALANGEYRTVKNNSPNILTFVRTKDDNMVLVLVNLSQHNEKVFIKPDEFTKKRKLFYRILFGNMYVKNTSNGTYIDVLPYAVGAWKLE